MLCKLEYIQDVFPVARFDRRMDMRGTTLRCLTIYYPPVLWAPPGPLGPRSPKGLYAYVLYDVQVSCPRTNEEKT